MVWFWVFQSLALMVFCACVYGAFRFRKDKLDDIEDWAKAKWKIVLKLWVVVFVGATLWMAEPLFNTVSCQFDGVAYKATTTYSWYKNGSYEEKCLFQGKNGTLLPLKITRDQPEGDHADVSQ